MWSLHFIGTPEAIKRALDTFGYNLRAEAREEFEKAKPALVDLVNLNHGNEDSLSLNASGSAEGNRRVVNVILMRSNAMHVQ